MSDFGGTCGRNLDSQLAARQNFTQRRASRAYGVSLMKF